MGKKSRVKLLESDGKTWSFCYSDNPEKCSKHKHSGSLRLAKLFKKDPYQINLNDMTVIHEDINGDTVTYFDYAVIGSERARDVPFECLDCGLNTLYAGEYYMVQDEIWNNHGVSRGMLCIGCLEARVGRKLNSNDFTDAPLNALDSRVAKSDRFVDRLKR